MLKITTVGGKEVSINPHMVSHLEETKDKGTRIWVPAANLYFDAKEGLQIIRSWWIEAILASQPLSRI